MPFTIGAIAAKDGAGNTITGGILAADTTGSGPWFTYHGLVDGVAGANKAQISAANALKVDVASITANPGVNIGDVGVTSLTPGNAAANIGKATDSVAGAADTGVAVLVVRKDALATLTPVDGDYVRLQTNSLGALHVTGVHLEDAAHASGAAGNLVLAVRQDSQVDFAADGDYVPFSIDADGALRVAGGGGGTQYTEDAAAAADPVGNVFLAVRRDTLSVSEVSADGDNIALKATNKGKLHVASEIRLGDTVADAGSGAMTAATQRVALATDSPGVNTTVEHGGIDAGDPVKMGAKAIAGLSGATLVSAADRTDLYAGLDGVQIVRPHCGLEDIVSGNQPSGGDSNEVIPASGVGIKTYLTSVVLTNTTTDDLFVEMLSGSTVRATIPVPAGGAIFNPPIPLPPNAANEPWLWRQSDQGSPPALVYCTAIGFKSKV